MLRSPWDYVPPPGRLRRLGRVACPGWLNPADVVAWNTDKTYLRELAAAGVPVIPTDCVAPGRVVDARPPTGEWVVKPTVSAGSQDTGRYALAGRSASWPRPHVARLTAAGRTAMVQPYLAAVDTAGETAVLFSRRRRRLAYSHAIRKGPMLTGTGGGRI